MIKLKEIKLSTQMMVAMASGATLGIVVGPRMQAIQFIGDIWINCLKMIIVPLVICVIVSGISSMDSPKTLGRIGSRTILFYTSTVVFAAIIAVLITSFIKPGLGFQFAKATKSFDPVKATTFKEFFTSLFSSNMFSSFSSGNLMQVLIIAIFFGIALVCLKDKQKEPLKAWFDNMTALFMSLVGIIMKFAPIGIFCLMASSLGQNGIGALSSIGKMLGTFFLCCLIQVLIVNVGLLWLTTKISPIAFMKKSSQVWLAAIATCSSIAVIPVNLEACEKFNVSNKISSFTIPFGVSFNQDGTAMLFVVTILFSAQAIGMHLGMLELIRVIIICVLTTMGGGGIPGSGIIKLMVASAACGMPLEIVAIVAAFYRFFDMGTTTMCCVNDLSCTIIIDEFENRRNTKMEKAIA